MNKIRKCDAAVAGHTSTCPSQFKIRSGVGDEIVGLILNIYLFIIYIIKLIYFLLTDVCCSLSHRPASVTVFFCSGVTVG